MNAEKSIWPVCWCVCTQHFNFFASQRLRLRRLVIGLEQLDFHSTPSSMKVTHTHTYTPSSQSPAFTMLRSYKDFPHSNLSFCSFLLLILSLSRSWRLSHFLIFSIISVSLFFFLPSLHLHIPIFRAAAFYFQASVPVQREGSWERPCYHCWDSLTASLSLSFLPPFSFYPVLCSSNPFRTVTPQVKACIFITIALFLSFVPPSFRLTLLPPFWKTYRRSFMWWSSGLIQFRHKQEMAPVI